MLQMEEFEQKEGILVSQIAALKTFQLHLGGGGGGGAVLCF